MSYYHRYSITCVSLCTFLLPNKMSESIVHEIRANQNKSNYLLSWTETAAPCKYYVRQTPQPYKMPIHISPTIQVIGLSDAVVICEFCHRGGPFVLWRFNVVFFLRLTFLLLNSPLFTGDFPSIAGIAARGEARKMFMNHRVRIKSCLG